MVPLQLMTNNKLSSDILIAEDDVIASQLLQMALEDLGFNVRITADGAEAWEAYQESIPSIIVSDWDMPEMDGIDFCRKVRATRPPEYVYFILLTAKAGYDNMMMAMEAGVDDFLTKPLDKHELHARIRVAQRIIGYTREIAALKEVIPICSYCKKIRQDDDFWEKLEVFMENNLNRDISHSICPDCYTKVIEPQFKEIEDRKKRGR